MATALVPGQRTWSLTRDDEGHREYVITHLVRAAATDGPKAVMDTPGLPVVGAVWNFDGDLDVWAFCTPSMKITPLIDKEPNQFWEVEQTFRTRPITRCQDETVDNPLLEPQQVSGGFVKYTKEVTEDKDGNPIKSSSHEIFRGPQVEFDHNRPTVRISQNVSQLRLGTITQMVDTVNDSALWGLAARCVKLSNVSWERKQWGQCETYYTRTFEFDIDFNTFDRTVLDMGKMVLSGHWNDETGVWTLDNVGGSAPDASNPTHFINAIDQNNNPIELLLDGAGKPLTDITAPVTINIQYYTESNFLSLGIPTSF